MMRRSTFQKRRGLRIPASWEMAAYLVAASGITAALYALGVAATRFAS